MSTETRRREPDDHVEAALQHPVEPGESSVEGAVLDVAGHLLGADQQALDLWLAGPRNVGALAQVDLKARPSQHVQSRSPKPSHPACPAASRLVAFISAAGLVAEGRRDAAPHAELVTA